MGQNDFPAVDFLFSDRLLDKFDLGCHFVCYISGSEVARSKPFPDPYLAALQALQTTADCATALEDSLTGYRSARAAGLTSVICPDHFIAKPENVFAGANLVVGSLLELNAIQLQRTHATRHPLARTHFCK